MIHLMALKNGMENGWRENLRSVGDTAPVIKYPKAVIPAKAGIQENTLDAGSSPAIILQG